MKNAFDHFNFTKTCIVYSVLTCKYRESYTTNCFSDKSIEKNDLSLNEMKPPRLHLQFDVISKIDNAKLKTFLSINQIDI